MTILSACYSIEIQLLFFSSSHSFRVVVVNLLEHLGLHLDPSQRSNQWLGLDLSCQEEEGGGKEGEGPRSSWPQLTSMGDVVLCNNKLWDIVTVTCCQVHLGVHLGAGQNVTIDHSTHIQLTPVDAVTLLLNYNTSKSRINRRYSCNGQQDWQHDTNYAKCALW